MHEIAKQLDLAFTRLYKEGYDVAVVRFLKGLSLPYSITAIIELC